LEENTMDDIQRAAERLHQAALSGTPCAPVRDLITDVAAAYAVQSANTQRALAAGRRLVGCKIGLTARAVQKQLGVDQPDYGMLFADMAVGDGEPIAVPRVMQPKVEAEVALVMERDVTTDQPTIADIARATAFVVPAIEIVGSRIANWDIRLVDTIADNASAGLYVLGGPLRGLKDLELQSCRMRMEVGGREASTGSGAACLGHPLNAAAWLARRMAELGMPLRAGDVVLTGALGPMAPVVPGEVAEATIEGLGSVRAVFDAS
jgi:2-keto-4-pentenoate hydratase